MKSEDKTEIPLAIPGYIRCRCLSCNKYFHVDLETPNVEIIANNYKCEKCQQPKKRGHLRRVK